jgi:hypothetical protein
VPTCYAITNPAALTATHTYGPLSTDGCCHPGFVNIVDQQHWTMVNFSRSGGSTRRALGGRVSWGVLSDSSFEFVDSH